MSDFDESRDTCSECAGWRHPISPIEQLVFGGVQRVSKKLDCTVCGGSGERRAWDGTGDLWEGWPTAPANLNG